MTEKRFYKNRDTEMDDNKKTLVNLLKTMIEAINQDNWVVPEYSLNIENDFDDYCNIPIRIRGRSYNLEFELKNCE
jgi:hypothetical protein